MISNVPVRFELVLEPTNTWTVWDQLNAIPAELAKKPLIGLDHSDATHALTKLQQHDRQVLAEGSFVWHAFEPVL